MNRTELYSLHQLTCSGVDLDGPTAGLAFKSTMCDDQSSVGLVQDKSNDVESVGSIAAHELGHILNMDHDGMDTHNNNRRHMIIILAVYCTLTETVDTEL